MWIDAEGHSDPTEPNNNGRLQKTPEERGMVRSVRRSRRNRKNLTEAKMIDKRSRVAIRRGAKAGATLEDRVRPPAVEK